MINLIITIFGVLFVIGGVLAMTLGFSTGTTPPNPIAFFIGLIVSVLGMISVIMFGSRIERGNLKIPSSEKKMPKKESPSNKTGQIIKPKAIPKNNKNPALSMKKPIIAKKPGETKNIKNIVSPESGAIAKEEKQVIPRKITPKRVPKIIKEPTMAKESPVIKEDNTTKSKLPNERNTSVVSEVPTKKDVKKERPKFTMGKVKSVRPGSKTEDEFVKNRLNKLKENYIKNAKDIENLIEERLDSFKGTLDQIKSESKDPSIIWSFDAGEVQETMKDTILKANNRILMMYPWVRNVDVSVLKRFMETESKMIIQEASLDDDASVELIKLLMDNHVEIRTMPHVHTVAIVSDEENGLIISTDPIYESFEVGVIYKDQKSIEEIERMFEEAWNLSQDISLEISQ